MMICSYWKEKEEKTTCQVAFFYLIERMLSMIWFFSYSGLILFYLVFLEFVVILKVEEIKIISSNVILGQ